MKDFSRTCECNSCVTRDCNSYEKIKYSCPMYTQDGGMRSTLLQHLIEDDRKTQNLYEVLEVHNMQIEETSYYPWFRLVLR